MKATKARLVEFDGYLTVHVSGSNRDWRMVGFAFEKNVNLNDFLRNYKEVELRTPGTLFFGSEVLAEI